MTKFPDFHHLTLFLVAWSLNFGPGILHAQTVKTLPETLYVDLNSAIIKAVEASPEVGIVAADRDFAAARLGLARASRFLTEFNATTAHSLAPGLKGREDTPTTELYLNPEVANDWDNLSPFNRIEAEAIQPLYTWGELSNNIKAADFGVQLENATVTEKEAEIALRTGELFMSLLLTEELFRLIDRTGDVLEQAKEEIQRLLEDGASDVDDADLFQVQISEQEFYRRVVEATQQREVARTALLRQLNLPDGTIVAPSTISLEPLAHTLDSLDTYFALAFDHRPELDQARAGLAARSALVNVAKSNFYPKLFAGLSANFSYAAGRFRQPSPYVGDPFRSRSLQLGLGFRQNLNFLQTKSRVEQAKAEYNQVKFQEEAAYLLILFEVEQAYRNLIIQQAALDAQNESLRISREWLLTEMNNFEFDLGDTENLVRAVQASLQLEATYYDAVNAYNVAVLELFDACGVLVERSRTGTLVE